MSDHDLDYYRARATEEDLRSRMAATPEAALIHSRLAEAYRVRAGQPDSEGPMAPGPQTQGRDADPTGGSRRSVEAR